MANKYYVYKHYNYFGDVIYVGATTNIKKRMTEHKSSSKHFKEVISYDYCKVENKTIMDLYEKYYINKFKPKYNKNSLNDDLSVLGLKELYFTQSKDILDFILERINFYYKEKIKEKELEIYRLKLDLIKNMDEQIKIIKNILSKQNK